MWCKKIKIVLFLVYIFIFINISVITSEIEVYCNGIEIQNLGAFNFNNVPADNRCEFVTFVIKNSGQNNLIVSSNPVIEITGVNSDEFEVNHNIPVNAQISPQMEVEFQVRFLSAAKDGQLKKADISIANNSSNAPGYSFRLLANAKTSGVVDCSNPGTYYWTAPYAAEAEVTLHGGSGGGGGGARSINSHVAIPNGMGSSVLIRSVGAGGGGGGSGYINTEYIELKTNYIYTIEVGAGGEGGQGATSSLSVTAGSKGESSFFIGIDKYGNPKTISADGGNGGGAGITGAGLNSNNYPALSFQNGTGGTGRINGEDAGGSSGSAYGYNGGKGADPDGDDHPAGGIGTRHHGVDGESASRIVGEYFGEGGGGGSGGGHDDYDSHNGGSGGEGSCGRVIIEWNGFILP